MELACCGWSWHPQVAQCATGRQSDLECVGRQHEDRQYRGFRDVLHLTPWSVVGLVLVQWAPCQGLLVRVPEKILRVTKFFIGGM